MTQLGFSRYLAHGGDLGAGISARLAAAHPDAVSGIHVLAVADPEDQDNLTDDERAYLAQARRWHAEEGGYEHLQRTRPLSAAYGLNDSPAGLLAWLLEKYHAWTDHQNGAPGLHDDLVLTQAGLYWFTDAIAPSFRPYWSTRTSRRVRSRSPSPPPWRCFPPTSCSRPGVGPSADMTSPATPACPGAATSPPSKRPACSPPTSAPSHGH
ncbi:alpha/beta fold hydrolase [Qaidamihabitans albus]|uniref:alpha/beta fold hydrolase n=1 Tax=Qaidamihabitans albus TaxID=2795733 RepID=UPI001F21D638|nr:hypothetical protein [Qaidamihabitans albus]